MSFFVFLSCLNVFLGFRFGARRRHGGGTYKGPETRRRRGREPGMEGETPGNPRGRGEVQCQRMKSNIVRSFRNSTESGLHLVRSFRRSTSSALHIARSFRNSTASGVRLVWSFHRSMIASTHIVGSFRNSTESGLHLVWGFRRSTSSALHIVRSFCNSTVSGMRLVRSFHRSMIASTHIARSFRNSTIMDCRKPGLIRKRREVWRENATLMSKVCKMPSFFGKTLLS